MMNKLIELKNLTKNFDDQQVLRGINLDIFVYQPESESCGANPIRKRGVAE